MSVTTYCLNWSLLTLIIHNVCCTITWQTMSNKQFWIWIWIWPYFQFFYLHFNARTVRHECVTGSLGVLCLRISKLYIKLKWQPYVQCASHTRMLQRPAHWKSSNFDKCVVVRWVCFRIRYSFVERAGPTLCFRSRSLCVGIVVHANTNVRGARRMNV